MVLAYYFLNYFKSEGGSKASLVIQHVDGVEEYIASGNQHLLLLISYGISFALIWYISASVPKKIQAFFFGLLLNIILFVSTLYAGDLPGMSLGSDFGILPQLFVNFILLAIFPLLYKKKTVVI